MMKFESLNENIGIWDNSKAKRDKKKLESKWKQWDFIYKLMWCYLICDVFLYAVKMASSPLN